MRHKKRTDRRDKNHVTRYKNWLHNRTGWFYSELDNHFAENFNVIVMEPPRIDIDTVMLPKEPIREYYFLIGDAYLMEFKVWCESTFNEPEIIYGQGSTR